MSNLEFQPAPLAGSTISRLLRQAGYPMVYRGDMRHKFGLCVQVSQRFDDIVVKVYSDIPAQYMAELTAQVDETLTSQGYTTRVGTANDEFTSFIYVNRRGEQ